MYNSINNYISSLVNEAKKTLLKEYGIERFGFSEFKLVNAFIVFKAIEKKINTLIKISNKNDRSNFYVPTIFILALQNFFKNYVLGDNEYNIGDVIQDKKGNRYKIISLKNGRYKTHNPKNNTIGSFSKKYINKYTIVKGDLLEGKAKVKFDAYINFFNSIFHVGKILPSKFKYKSIVVTNKDIIDNLKDFEYRGLKINKAFPFEYWPTSSDGSVGNINPNLPLDPMFYIVSEYETASNFILKNSSINIENVFIIGSNKYRNVIPIISNDIRSKKFKNCILIGTEDIDGIMDLYKWNWTAPEINIFTKTNITPINKVEINYPELSKEITITHDQINSIEREYCISIRSLYGIIRKIFSIVGTDSNSRLNNQISTFQHYIEKKIAEIIEDKFFEIGKFEIEEILKSIKYQLKLIFQLVVKKSLKYGALKKIRNLDFLVVPSDDINVWNENLINIGFNNSRAISFKEFEYIRFDNPKNICFLSFYGYNQLVSMIQSNHKIIILLYDEENKLYEKYHSRYEDIIYNEIQSPDRKKICSINIKKKSKIEQINDLIERFYNQEQIENVDMGHYSKSYLGVNTYQIEYEDGYIQTLESNKNIMLIENNVPRGEKIHNLIPGDTIRVYDNCKKEQLYKMAYKDDSGGRFKQIEYCSNLWKIKFREYYDKKFNNLEDIFNILIQKGISIRNISTLKNWINLYSDVKFPQSIRDLYILKEIVNSSKLNDEFKTVLFCRRLYHSIMIALGRDLSDEIMMYVKNGQKGTNLAKLENEEVKNIVNLNAPKRKIKTIKIVDENE